MNKYIKILLVDDDELDRYAIKRTFEAANIINPIYEAADGEQALEILQESNISIVLLDLNMPKMDGFDFLQKVRSLYDDLIIVILTSSDYEKDVQQAYKYNVNGYFVKPIDSRQLFEKMGVFGEYWSLCEVPKSGKNNFSR